MSVDLPTTSRPYRRVRRAVDVSAAVAGIALASPALAVACLAIAAIDGRPILYRQLRVGQDGREFKVIKFRSMTINAEFEGSGLRVESKDVRITRTGQLLRRTSLDELPQLFNVLNGDMSLIGPRPTVPSQVANYGSHELRRLSVKPGITGWAQVNGRNSLSWAERIELDLWYIDNRDLRLDARIIGRTIRSLFNSADLYPDAR